MSMLEGSEFQKKNEFVHGQKTTKQQSFSYSQVGQTIVICYELSLFVLLMLFGVPQNRKRIEKIIS